MQFAPAALTKPTMPPAPTAIQGAGSIFLDRAEDDGGQKISQVSVTISDKGKAIGAITLGIDVGKLK